MSPPVPAGCYCPPLDLPPQVDLDRRVLLITILITRVGLSAHLPCLRPGKVSREPFAFSPAINTHRLVGGWRGSVPG